MDIVVKGRHTEVPEGFREHVAEKLAKLERLNSRMIRVDVQLIHEPNRRLSDYCERVELTCHSRGPVIRAEAAADEAHAALDLALAKLEERLRRAADRRRVHHGTRTPVSISAALAGAAAPASRGPRAADAPDSAELTRAAESTRAAEPAEDTDLDEEDAGLITGRVHVDGDGPLVVREKLHKSAPMTLEQALHEMELVGHDFYLFWDQDADVPSVVYCRRGYDYGVIRLHHVEVRPQL